SLNTVRIHTLRCRGGDPYVELCNLKMASNDSFIDADYSGRLIAAIDVKTGQLGTAISPDPTHPDVDIHPATKALGHFAVYCRHCSAADGNRGDDNDLLRPAQAHPRRL